MSEPAANPCVLIELVPDQQDSFVIQVCFANLDPGEQVELSFVETGVLPDGTARPERVLGKDAGVLMQLGKSGRLGFVPKSPAKPQRVEAPRVTFRLDAEQGPSDYLFALSKEHWASAEGDCWQVLVRADSHGIESPAIPLARVRRQPEQGDEAAGNVQYKGFDLRKAPDRVKAPSKLGGATYDWHAGHDVIFYNDGSTDAKGSAGAFKDMLDAIEAAKHFMFIVDWSFQPLFCVSRKKAPSAEESIGRLLLKKTENADFVAAIHTWNHSEVGAADSPNDLGGYTLDRLARGRRPPNLLWRKSSRTGVGWSHHQKFVVLDAEGPDGRRELRVFWGGLDLTQGRFDWPGHPLHDSEGAHFKTTYGLKGYPARTHDWYNLEFAAEKDLLELPRQPWHDIHGSLKGPAAWDFVREFVGRWNTGGHSGSDDGDFAPDDRKRLWDVFRKLHGDRETFVQQFEGKRTGPFSAQVYRSLVLEHWAPPPGRPRDKLDERLYALLRTDRTQMTEQSIRLAYQHNIEHAEKFIYIENQYFMGSGRLWVAPNRNPALDNDIPELLVKRILRAIAEDKPFHVYIILPMFPEGNPVDGIICEVRFNEWRTMEYMVGAISAAIAEAKAKAPTAAESTKTQRRWTDYLSFYFLANWSQKPYSKKRERKERVREHARYMVYVHSKLMIVDDRYALFGSCNLNDRGLSGVGDSEIACGVWPSHGQASVAAEIKRFRQRLWEEHWGTGMPHSDAPGSSACVSEASRRADENYVAFRSMTRGATQGHVCRLPLVVGKKGLTLQEARGYPDDSLCLPDAPRLDDMQEDSKKKHAPEWAWAAPGSDFFRFSGLTE